MVEVIKYFLIFIACLFVSGVYAAQVVNVEYIHNKIYDKWNLDIPYNAALDNPKVAANMEYLLTTVDVANTMLNGAPISNYADGVYATMAAADTIAADYAVDTLIKYVGPKVMISLDADDGNGIVNTVSCSSSGTCVLPYPGVTKDKYAFTGKWCTEKSGAGTCWDAKTDYSVDSFANDVTLYAEWKPVYKITVIASSGEFAGATMPVPESFWLLYGVKWCADEHCQNDLVELSKMPALPGYEFDGIKTVAMSWMGVKANTIIDKDGRFVMDDAALTTASAAASAIMSWERGQTYCAPGTYYVGHGTQYNSAYCQSCMVGNYCSGGNFVTTYQDFSIASGLSQCPDGGATLVSGADSITDCVKVVEYNTDNGSGIQSCYMGENGQYNQKCFDFVISKCNAGYWLENETDANCSPVDYGYYSVNNSLTRVRCNNGGITDSQIASGSSDCYKPENCDGGGVRKCYYNPLNGAYVNCTSCVQ